MPRATCRCGQLLSVPVNGPSRVVCPKCSAKIRVRRESPGPEEGDGFLRFPCECGRRLKVRHETMGASPQTVKCPDCFRIVPVPVSSSSGGDLKLKSQGPESPTEELDANDLATLDRWTERHLGALPESSSAPEPDPEPEPAPVTVAAPPAPAPAPAAVKAEAGLRICPRCGRPLHLSAVACRNCGAPVPRK